MKLSDQIYGILVDSNGLKARAIAEKLGVDKKEVNSCLYGELIGKCYQDSSYVWHANKEKEKSKTSSVENNPPDKLLSDICRYYLNCLSIDDSNSIKTFARGQFGLDYTELAQVDFENVSGEGISRLTSKMHNNRNMTAYFGYPVMIDKIVSRKNSQEYYFVVPVLVYQTELLENGIVKVDPIPRINPEVVKKFSSEDQSSLIYEILKLENDLGLDSNEIDIEIDELVDRLVSIQTHWEWKEEIDPERLSSGISLSEINDEGIYNRAIVLLTERSPYTQGLEKELHLLSSLSEENYKGTALYNWIHQTHQIYHEKNNEQILEVLPLNSEQEQAIKTSLNEDLTIITGPPGTGKSQVVTDLLVNVAWKNKSALFASKNNKAVDVVEQRVNGLGKTPILLRIGNNTYANRLAELVQNLLSVTSNPEDKAEYGRILSNYNSIYDERKTLVAQKQKIIALRNKVDLLEQKTEQYRDGLESIWNVIKEEDIDRYRRILYSFEKAFLYVQKTRQPWIIRLVWPLVASARIKEYEKQALEMSMVLFALQLDTISDKYTESAITAVQRAIVSAKTRLENLDSLQEYKDLLKLLESEEKLEQIDRRTYKLKNQLSTAAAKLWAKWLTVKPTSIAQTDRKELTGFLAALRLYTGASNDEDTPYNAELNKLIEKVRIKMSRYLPCWAVTSLSVNRKVPFEPGLFDLLVIDEASQCDIASALPLLYRAKKAVIIGDPMQLSHITAITNKQDTSLIMKYKVPFEWSYKAISLFDLARSLADPQNIVDLRDHHRSHAEIISFSNREFYKDQLRVATRYDQLVLPAKETPGVRWVHKAGNTSRPSGGGAVNRIEAEELVKVLRHLAFDNGYQGSVGAVTPFRAQAECIREIIARDTKLIEKLQTVNDFLVDTVHKFQGDERDIMLFSPVVSNGISSGALGFLANTGNLFNVAITRARAMLIVVGDRQACSSCDVKYLEHFADYTISLENKVPIIPESLEYPGAEYPVVSNPEQVSDWERHLYSSLYKAGIFTVPQYPVEKYSLDLALFEGDRKLDIEVDGEMYHRDWNGELCYRDQLRNHRLYEQGWDVIRFWVYQVRDDMGWCIKQIEDWKCGNH